MRLMLVIIIACMSFIIGVMLVQIQAQEYTKSELLYAVGYTTLQANGMHYRPPFALMGSQFINNNDFTILENQTITKIEVLTNIDTLDTGATSQACLYDNVNMTVIQCVPINGNAPSEYIIEDLNIQLHQGDKIAVYIQIQNRTSGMLAPTVYIYGY